MFAIAGEVKTEATSFHCVRLDRTPPLLTTCLVNAKQYDITRAGSTPYQMLGRGEWKSEFSDRNFLCFSES